MFGFRAFRGLAAFLVTHVFDWVDPACLNVVAADPIAQRSGRTISGHLPWLAAARLLLLDDGNRASR